MQVPNRHFRKVGAAIFLMASQLSGVFTKEGRYPLLKTQMVNAEPYENSDAYRLEAPNWHFRKVWSEIHLKAPHLSGVLPKEDFYNLLKTLMANAEPYENPDAYRLKVPSLHFRRVWSVISLMAPKLADAFTNVGFLSASENADGKCGDVRKSRFLLYGGKNRNIQKFGSAISIKVPQLYDVLSKEEFYPLLKTHLVNADPYENPDADRLKAPNRHCLKVGDAIPLREPKLYDVFPKDDCYHLQKQ